MKVSPHTAPPKEKNRLTTGLIKLLILVVVGGGTTVLGLFVLAWLIIFTVAIFLF